MLVKSYAACVFFNQYGMIEVEKDKGHLIDAHLVFPPERRVMSKHIPRLDMIDIRTGLSALDTAFMLQPYMQNRTFESSKNRPDAETECICFRRRSDSPTY